MTEEDGAEEALTCECCSWEGIDVELYNEQLLCLVCRSAASFVDNGITKVKNMNPFHLSILMRSVVAQSVSAMLSGAIAQIKEDVEDHLIRALSLFNPERADEIVSVLQEHKPEKPN